MADAVSRDMKFKDAALVLADDAVEAAVKLRSCIRKGHRETAESLAAGLQRTARDAKWLIARQSKG